MVDGRGEEAKPVMDQWSDLENTLSLSAKRDFKHLSFIYLLGCTRSWLWHLGSCSLGLNPDSPALRAQS